MLWTAHGAIGSAFERLTPRGGEVLGARWYRADDKVLKARANLSLENLAGAIADAIEPLYKRIFALEKRLAEVKGFHYRGTWDATTDYQVGDFVTHGRDGKEAGR